MTTTRRKRRSKAAWYGVKTIFRTKVVGRPTARDSAYDATVSLVEERIVLFKADSSGAAIRAAEAEARSYARSSYLNPYGQRVETRYLGACDAFELFEAPGPRVEVFSRTQMVPKGMPDRAIVSQLLGPPVSEAADRARRRNVLNREFSGSVRRGA